MAPASLRVTVSRTPWLVPAVVVAAAVAVVALSRVLDVRTVLAAALDRLSALGPLGPLALVPLYVVVTVTLLPAVVLTLGAGAAFGVAWGFVAVWLGATLGATAAFLIGRYVARDWVVARMRGRPAFHAIDDAVARDGWKIVALTRLSPAFPFVLLNYAFSVTRVSMRGYVAASALGMIPGIAVYVYLGAIAGSLAAAGAGRGERTPAEWALSAVGLLATIAVTAYVTRLARGALRRRSVA